MKPIYERAMVFVGRSADGNVLSGPVVRWPRDLAHAREQFALMCHERPDCDHAHVRCIEDDEGKPCDALYVCTLIWTTSADAWRVRGWSVEVPDEFCVCEAQPSEHAQLNMMAQPELLPCPFCGGKAVSRKLGPEDQRYWVACLACAVEGPWEKTPAGATKGWNTRWSV